MNILTDRQVCEQRCPYTTDRYDRGDVRQCEHGKWWVAKGEITRGYYVSRLHVWRRTTWRERRRIKRLMEPEP